MVMPADGNRKRRTRNAVDTWKTRSRGSDGFGKPKPRIASMAVTIPVDILPEKFKSVGGKYGSGKGENSETSQRRCISSPNIAISALSQHSYVNWPAVTLLFRSKPLSLPETTSYSHKNSNQSPFLFLKNLFEAAFKGIIRWKFKSLADTIVVIIAFFTPYSPPLTKILKTV